MADDRVKEHARIVVEYSCQVKRNDFVFILAPSEANELVAEIVSRIGSSGARYLNVNADPSILRAFKLSADDETLSVLPPQLLNLMRDSDVFIQILASSNTQEESDVLPRKNQLYARGRGPFFDEMLKKRWNVTLHPTKALAQEAKMSYAGYCDFVYAATLRDWPKARSEMKILQDRLAAAKMVRIVGKDTDITFSVEGRRPLIDGGELNLPGGEVYVSPVDSTVNGDVYFDLPVVYYGRDVRGAHLSFKDGVVEESSAEDGYDILKEMLAVDDGARRVGELGIGMNRGIGKFTRNILFDEKMGDTIHMAVGHAYEETGGTNKSAIHIDMIKGLKEGGAVYFDGVPIYESGKFTWE